MTINNLNKITWKRARAVVIGFGFLLILLSFANGMQTANQWHKDQNFIKSEQATKDYNSDIKEQKKIENKINKHYNTYKDYGKSLDYGYSIGAYGEIKFDSIENKFVVPVPSFDEYYEYLNPKLFRSNAIDSLVETGTIFTTSNFIRNLSYLSLFFLIVGYLITFLDYKTNFQLILFSSGYRRKDILKSKIRTSLPPLILFSAISMGINLLVIYSRIPHQNINYPLDKIIYYQLCVFVVASCYYFVGLFSGIIFGQTFTGIISFLGFTLGLELVKANILVALQLSIRDNDIHYLGSFFSEFDSYSNWVVLSCIILFLSFLIYLASQFIYNKISLEERNNYLLLSNLKLPFALGASAYTTFALTDIYRLLIFQEIVIFVITFLIFIFLSNYKNVSEKTKNKFYRQNS